MIATARIIRELKLDDFALETKTYCWLELVHDAMGVPVRMPVIVARGKHDGPVLGLTAAVHGNEVNGSQVIQRLFDDLNVAELKGTLIGVPVVNVPAFNKIQRNFTDGQDLNRIMPGRQNGNSGQVYAYRFIERVVRRFDYLLDLHTASFGRVNSYYIRADLQDASTRKLAELQNAQILVHNKASDGTLRGAADALGIPSITLEVGNPNMFQRKMIRSGMQGIHNTLVYLGMIPDAYENATTDFVTCKSSYWIYTDVGGLLTVHVGLADRIEAGQHIATVRDVFGYILREFYAPEDGIVIGKSTSPANQTGGRIMHLGILE